jgi:hypothetical protein
MIFQDKWLILEDKSSVECLERFSEDARPA